MTWTSSRWRIDFHVFYKKTLRVWSVPDRSTSVSRFPLNVYIMDPSCSFISSRRTTKEWQLGCRDGSGGLWWVLQKRYWTWWVIQSKETAWLIYFCHWVYVTPKFLLYIYIIYIKKELLGQQNWCPNQYVETVKMNSIFFVYCWRPQFPTVLTLYSGDLDRILRWNLLVRQKKLTSTWAGTR